METIEYAQLTEALVIWTGWGRESWPHRDDSAVINHFGPKLATKLLAKIKVLMDDFYSSNANLAADSLQEMGKISAEQFKGKHPEIPEEIVKMFVWCYTFDNR